MDNYILFITLIGFAAFGMAWMPAITKLTGISYSLIYVFGGVVIYTFFPSAFPIANPIDNNMVALRYSEMVVIISLMGTGLKIDRTFSFKNWATPLKLVMITMIISIGAAAFLGYVYLGLSLASAVLIGAVLAPTDPVLASDIQVGRPNEGKKSETKFSLTAEGGLNDGMAFPFTWLAIILFAGNTDNNLINWFSYHLLYKVAVGLIIGYLAGRGVGYLVFRWSVKHNVIKHEDGFLAISLTLLVYGITEIIHGYGFIAVFICAYTLRHFEKGHEYHKELHSFTDQAERFLVAVLLIVFGGSLVNGILSPLTWKMVIFSLTFLFVIRPIAGYCSVARSDIHWKEKFAISFFGIRGIGSVFYLAFAFHEAQFANKEELWAIAAFTILISVLIHGVSATYIMKHLKKNVERGEVPKNKAESE